MESKVAIYNSQEQAISAVKLLDKSGFPLGKVSMVGKAELVGGDFHIKSLESLTNAPLILGAGTGAVVGLLTGLGVFSIPGFGFLYGAGAIIGVIGGFDLGLVGGGIVTIFAKLGIRKTSYVEYEEHLKIGRFMIVVQGSLNEIKLAEKVLHTQGTHLAFGV